jgi:hypothetical protein
MYSSTENSEVVLVFERNNAGFNKLSEVLPEETSDSSAFLNVTFILKYVLNYDQHIFFFFHILIRINEG